jgi:hypothetical protein
MDTFSPEFTAYWLAEPRESADLRQSATVSNDNALSPSQQVALEELAERINAARRVV